MKTLAFAVAAFIAALPAFAADDRFYKDKPGSMHGFLAATDPVYVKECGTCHFPYSPGILPARSWERHIERLGKHFGENIQLAPTTRDVIRKYLVENAADVSPYEGSKAFMERVEPAQTPYRFNDVLLYRTMHRIVREVIETKPKVKVRNLTNCNGCHQRAEEGSFGLPELFIPGLTPSNTLPPK
jgi:hypothetical protein